MKLNLFFYRVLIFVFKRRFEVKVTLIHDIWRYICVEFFFDSIKMMKIQRKKMKMMNIFIIFLDFFSFLIKIYFKK